MWITEVCTLNQIKSLVATMLFEKGLLATKDWILTHIEPGSTQADAMGTLVKTCMNTIY